MRTYRTRRVRLYDANDDQSNSHRSFKSLRQRRKRGDIGPYSRSIDRGAIGAVSGRSREGRFLRGYERMLLEHVGGQGTIVQRAMITRAARLALHLELLDEKVFINGYSLTEHDYNHYCAWSNSLCRTLARLGLEQPTAAG